MLISTFFHALVSEREKSHVRSHMGAASICGSRTYWPFGYEGVEKEMKYFTARQMKRFAFTFL